MPSLNPRVGALTDPFATSSVVPLPVPDQEEGFGIPVYWPGDRMHTERVDSKLYVFPPRSVKTIYGTRRHQVDGKGKLLLDRETIVKETAESLVKALIQKAEHKGLVALTGNPAKDEPAKAKGRGLWATWRLQECETIIANHEMDCARAESIGKLPPRPNQAWRDAKTDLDLIQAVADDRRRFVCRKDGMDFDLEQDLFDYITRAYPGTDPKTLAKDTRPGDPKPTAEDIAKIRAAREDDTPDLQLPPLEDPGASSSLDSEVKALVLRAAMDGIAFPADLREGLKSNDPEIVAVALAEAKSILDGPQG